MEPLRWHFPLPRPYTGILLGNARMGLMIWGIDCLSLTIGQTGFWDHRGGIPFAAQTNYQMLRDLLESNDEAGLNATFSNPGGKLPYRTPTQLPAGRLDLYFKNGARPESADLDTSRGSLVVHLDSGASMRLCLSMERDLAWLILKGAALERIELVPAWRWIGETLAKGGVQAPEQWGDATGGGFRQNLPEDDGMTVAWALRGSTLSLATGLGDAGADYAMKAASTADLLIEEAATEAWWHQYSTTLPKLSLPDPALQRAWDYGLYKMAGMHQPTGRPATLQGPWMAENSLPPWSNDFHFNINLQMIYWPVYPANRLEHLKPLWQLIREWLPDLQANAAAFFSNPRALMLPHAVDDRCQVIGNYWMGTIDQACTAWMAQMAWLHYRHSMDETILRDIAWPLLSGAFEGYWTMMEESEENGRKRLSLPVSVSAEFWGWGRDASFQLAAFHMLAQLLPNAAEVLGETVDPRWARVRDELPPYTTLPLAKVPGKKELLPRIVLWHNQDLTESHRHHSHLAAIFPFRTLSPFEDTHRAVIKRSMEHWAAMGSGQWVGWSMPWAAALWARCDYASAAVSILRIWEDVFTNEGGQTLHNADSPGYSSWLHRPFFDWPQSERTTDQMQMDAGFGAIQAIVEILVQQRGDSLHVLPSLPKQWRDFSFDGILTEGAFLVGADVRDSRVVEIRIHSLKGQKLILAGRPPIQTHAGQQLVFRN